MKQYLSLALSGLLLFQAGKGAAQQQQAGAPVTDPKLTPSISGNSSIGSIYSPNLFNGTTNIGIPIYDFSNDYGSFGVSLGYNTKGVKVDELASAVGLHWTLNAGGGITRALKDLPDEARGTVHQDPDYPSNGDNLFEGRAYRSSRGMSFHTVTQIRGDYESDDFMVSVGTLNFTFNIASNGYKFIHPKRNVRIELLNGGVVIDTMAKGVDYTNFTFRITDEQGTVYHFVKGDVQQYLLYDRHQTMPEVEYDCNYTSRWVIDRIQFANGSEIKYSYRETQLTGEPLYKAWLDYGSEYGSTSKRDQIIEANGSTWEPISISYPNGVLVSFIYNKDLSPVYERCDSRSESYLKKIQVSSRTEKLIYRLNQVFSVAAKGATAATEIPTTALTLSACRFHSGTGSTTEWARYHRLILKGIEICSGDETKIEPYYTFEYNTTMLPPRLSTAQDWFGYYNGKTANTTLIPTNATLGVGADRNEVLSSSKAQILTKVTNAYGGSIAFDYESHSAINVLAGLPTDPNFLGTNAGDGLKLRDVTETDKYHPSSFRKTEFIYTGGQQFLSGGYFHFVDEVDGIGNPSSYRFNSIFTSPHQLVNGSNQGYSDVTVTVRDQDLNQLSKKNTKFTNFKDEGGSPKYTLKGGNKHFYQFPYSDKQYIRDWEIGLPIEVTDYDENDKIVSKVRNSYTFTLDTAAASLPVNKKYLEFPPLTGTNRSRDIFKFVKSDSDSYRPYTGLALLNRSIMDKYISDAIIVRDTIFYTYDSRNNPLANKVRNSKGEYTVLKNVYNYNVAGPGIGGVATSPLYRMTADGIEQLVGTERWKSGATATADKLLDASITKFNYENGRVLTKGLYAMQASAAPTFLEHTGTSTPSAFLFTKARQVNEGGNPAGFKNMSEVQLFDNKGNPQETKLLGQEQYVAMIWDTISGRKLAEANAKYNEIAFAGFDQTPDLTVSYHSGSLITYGRFTYRALGTTASTGSIPTGICSRFYALTGNPVTTSGLTPNREYLMSFWSTGALPVVSGAGVGTITLVSSHTVGIWKYYTARFTPTTTGALTLSTAGITHVDEIRLHPSNAVMTSSTFNPLFGIRASSDATGRITYAEYDKLGRPTLSRDQEGNIISRTMYIVQ